MKAPTKPAPRIGGDICLYAIGDIHGHKNKLVQLIRTIEADAATNPAPCKQLVFVGDYIDRGNESKAVIDFLLHDLPEIFEPVFLRGNHEDVVLRIIDGETDIIPSWLQFGGAAFLASYGINPFRPGLSQRPDILQKELTEKLPPAHLDFLRATEFSYTCGDYYFAHAGARPAVNLNEQSSNDLMWIRHEFLASKHDFGPIIVHGHSITPQPDIQPNRIGIDTGAYATGKLTAIKLWQDQRQFFTT